jgi:hypothetical protein
VQELFDDCTLWHACESGWQLAGSREYATDADPLIEATVAVDGDPAVVATLDGRVMRVRPARGLTPPPLRNATAKETVECGVRWALGWGHLGCVEPDEFAFWARRTEARLYVATHVDAWLAEGARVSLEGLEGRPGIFVAYVGDDVHFRGLSDIVDALDANHPEALVGAGIFVTAAAGARALIAVADLHGCPQMPGGDTSASL